MTAKNESKKPPTRKNSLPEDPKTPVKRTAPNVPVTVPSNPGTSQTQQGDTTPHHPVAQDILVEEAIATDIK